MSSTVLQTVMSSMKLTYHFAYILLLFGSIFPRSWGITNSPTTQPSSSTYFSQSAGLIYKMYDGYHEDFTPYSTTGVARNGYNGVSSGTSIDLGNLAVATSNNVIGHPNDNNGLQTFSIEWLGYFYTLGGSGTYTFSMSSDDGSYLWLGISALDGYTTSNVLVNNGAQHTAAAVSTSISLTANTYYPIRILYGQNPGYLEMTLIFSIPSGARYSNGNGYYFTRNYAGTEFINIQHRIEFITIIRLN